MKLYNYEVEAFAQFLLSLELSGKRSRMRTKLCKILGERLKEIDDDRIALAKDYAEKDENGEAKSKQLEDGHSVFIMKDQDAFNREYQILTNEEFIIEKTAERADMFDTVKEVVLNTNRTFSGHEALLYDRWCEIVEGE